MRFFKKDRIAVGVGHIDKYTVFEFRRGISLFMHVFNTEYQDRYHDHAFAAVSIIVRGQYREDTPYDGVKQLRAPGIRIIPKLYSHRIMKSSANAVSITIAGPWRREWMEIFTDGNWRRLTWGRKVLEKGKLTGFYR